MTSPPIGCDPLLYNENELTSPLFHRDLETISVELTTLCKERPRVGHSLVRLSFLLTALDHQVALFLANIHEQIQRAEKPSDYQHVPPTEPTRFFVMGRNTYGVQISVNGFLYFARTMLDQVMDLVAATLGVSFRGGSFTWARPSKRDELRRRLAAVGGEPAAELLIQAWDGWGEELRDRRDLLGHRDALAIPPLELVEDPATGAVVGARIYFPESPRDHKLAPARGRSFVNCSDYLSTTRQQLAALTEQMIRTLLDCRGGSSAAPAEGALP